jgi:hypothetical protein
MPFLPLSIPFDTELDGKEDVMFLAGQTKKGLLAPELSDIAS